MTLETQDIAGVDEPWISRYWRPAIGVMYIVINCFDFILFPILTALYQAALKIIPPVGWDPLTLRAGGLFHIAIGAILTATSFGRSQEKIQALKTGFGESGTTTTTTSYGQQGQQQPVQPARYPLRREPEGG